MDLHEEIVEVMKLDRLHKSFFSHHKRPTIEEWKSLRAAYLKPQTVHDPNTIDHKNEQPRWFNSVDITLYMRNPTDVKPAAFKAA